VTLENLQVIIHKILIRISNQGGREVGHVVRMVKIRNSYRVLAGKFYEVRQHWRRFWSRCSSSSSSSSSCSSSSSSSSRIIIISKGRGIRWNAMAQ
jgi:hypothetical protein